MKYSEEQRDLFSVSKDYFLVQCISADFGMGAGIAVEFNRLFNMKNRLLSRFNGNVIKEWDSATKKGGCIVEAGTFNMITKRLVHEKPTYETFTNSLERVKEIAIKHDVKKLAMPLIGCGLDKLEWDKVSQIIKDIFNDTDIEILVCIK